MRCILPTFNFAPGNRERKGLSLLSFKFCGGGGGGGGELTPEAASAAILGTCHLHLYTRTSPQKTLFSFYSLHWNLAWSFHFIIALYDFPGPVDLSHKKSIFCFCCSSCVLFCTDLIYPYLGYLPEVSPPPATNFYVRNQSQFVFVCIAQDFIFHFYPQAM